MGARRARRCAGGVGLGAGRLAGRARLAEPGLEAPQAFFEGGLRGLELRPRDLHEGQLELQTGVEAVTDLALRLAEPLDHADQLARRQLVRLRQQAPHLLVVQFHRLAQHAQRRLVVGGLLEVLQQEQLTQVAQQIADELRVIDAFVGQALHELQRRRRLALDAEVRHLEEQVAAGDPERLEHVGRHDGRPRRR